jgi:hypothetical protein
MQSSRTNPKRKRPLSLAFRLALITFLAGVIQLSPNSAPRIQWPSTVRPVPSAAGLPWPWRSRPPPARRVWLQAGKTNCTDDRQHQRARFGARYRQGALPRHVADRRKSWAAAAEVKKNLGIEPPISHARGVFYVNQGKSHPPSLPAAVPHLRAQALARIRMRYDDYRTISGRRRRPARRRQPRVGMAHRRRRSTSGGGGACWPPQASVRSLLETSLFAAKQ